MPARVHAASSDDWMHRSPKIAKAIPVSMLSKRKPSGAIGIHFKAADYGTPALHPRGQNRPQDLPSPIISVNDERP